MEIDRTVQAVFDKAIYLIDAQRESDGSTKTSETKEYEVRAIGILNTLIDEAYPASDTWPPPENGRRPALGDIAEFTDELDLDPYILRSVLPYGLAARLLMEENASASDFLWQTYLERLARARQERPAEFEDLCGGNDAFSVGIEYGEFSRW